MTRQSSTANGRDFSEVDSRAKAEALVRSGVLEKVFLLPAEFGGADIAQNIVYAPIGVAQTKAGIDMNVIAPLVSSGKVSQYAAVPEWQGASFVPVAIAITASGPGDFSAAIKIWGSALD